MKFDTKVNLACVGSDGTVDFNKFSGFKWAAKESMETVLIAIYKEMQSSSNKSKAQPGEGETY